MRQGVVKQALSQRQPWVNRTVLSGDLNGDDGPAYENYNDNSRNVLVAEQGTIDGFRITGANGGCGVGGSSLILRSCLMTANRGVGASASSSTIQDCAFIGNDGDVGGGLYGFDMIVRNCEFNGNHAGRGGGVYTWSWESTFEGCSFSGNTACYSGGGLFAERATIRNCQFIGNRSGTEGGGAGAVAAVVEDCEFAANQAETGGGAFIAYDVWTQEHVKLTGTIRNCQFRANSAVCGGGAAMQGGEASRCEFIGNSASDDGGGLQFAGRGTVRDCLFQLNSAVESGGGVNNVYMQMPGNNFNIIDCAFIENNAERGGGLGGSGYHEHYPWGFHLALQRCQFIRNACRADGGALYPYYQYALISDCTLDGNVAYNSGGGLHNVEPITDLRNCTFVRNGAPRGSAICNFTGATQAVNCIFWLSEPDPLAVVSGVLDLTFSDVEGGWPGVGNIAVDPQFVALDDLHLAAGSPAIDAGDPDSIVAGQQDLDGRLRPWDGDGDGVTRIDMGAYERGGPLYGDLNCDGAINAFDIDPFVLALVDPAAYAAQYPGCPVQLADLDGDGRVSVFDIDPFLELLLEL